MQNYFSILTDHQLNQPDISLAFAAAGISLNPRSPASIHHLLRHERHGPVVRHDWVATLGSSDPPSLTGDWTWSNGSTTSLRTFVAVAGDNMKWTYQGSGTHHVEIKDHNNAVPSMTVEVNGVLYDWVPANEHLLAQTGQGSDGWTWTKTTTRFSYFIAKVGSAFELHLKKGISTHLAYKTIDNYQEVTSR